MIITQKQLKNYNWILISITLAIYVAVVLGFKLNITNALLLLLATPTLLWFLLKVLIPVLKKMFTNAYDDQRKMDQAIAHAKKIGYTPYYIGAMKHVVWAKNIKQANAIFHHNIKPHLKPDNKKRIDYVSKQFNNL